MSNANEEKTKQLGMPIGTASNSLRKKILFNILKKHDENICFQCGKEIETVDELSVEHKIPWLHSKTPKELFFDLDNIAFSHLTCNIKAARTNELVHGTDSMYNKKRCRCVSCTEAHKLAKRDYRKRNK